MLDGTRTVIQAERRPGVIRGTSSIIQGNNKRQVVLVNY